MGVHIFISFTKELVRFRERRGATSTWCLEGKWEHLWKPRVSTIIGQKPIIIYNNACSYIGVVCAYKVCKLAHTSFQQKYEKILKTRKLNGNDFVREAFVGKKGRRGNPNSFLCVTCKTLRVLSGPKKKKKGPPPRETIISPQQLIFWLRKAPSVSCSTWRTRFAIWPSLSIGGLREKLAHLFMGLNICLFACVYACCSQSLIKHHHSKVTDFRKILVILQLKKIVGHILSREKGGR